MARERLIGTGLAPGRTATPPHAVVSADPLRCVRPMSASPFPADSVASMASPRACHTSAPPRGRVVESLSNGATEHSSRGCQTVGLAVTTRVISTSNAANRNTWQSRVPESPRAAQESQRCPVCKDAIGDGARGIWGAIFGTDDEARDQMRASEEVVLCLSTTVGTDRTHGVLRDSGVANSADPGASFLTWIRDTEISPMAQWGNKRSRCWLLDGGSWGGRRAGLKTPVASRDRRTT